MSEISPICISDEDLTISNSSPSPCIIDQGRGKVLLYHGFMYHRNQVRNNRTYWRCTKKTCRSSLQTNNFDVEDAHSSIVVNNVREHNHPPQDDLIQKQTDLNKIKAERLGEDPSKASNQHAHDEVGFPLNYSYMRYESPHFLSSSMFYSTQDS